MSGRNIIALDPSRRARKAFPEKGIVAMLIFLIFDAMLFTGMVGIFMLTRTAAGGEWPPAGQPWFPPGETAINTAALLLSGALVFRSARMWEKREARIGPLLFTAILLGAFFVFFQGVVWVGLIGQGLSLTSSQHGHFFYLVAGMHGAHVVGGLIFLGIVWRRLKPVHDDDGPRGSLTSGTFKTARIFWYFVVGVWPVLYFSLYF
ncbi:MAG: heme-copper oxidase subunit III [Deltaproteobacteria bacterium]|nr:heme-copper oxidase subunit III [Deltaproteobacteria bacterium]MBW2446679.1 heme-copper oxidase subunit III [Deltaproteobacteria bacterium]